MKKHLILLLMVVAPWYLSAQTPTLSIASGATVTIDAGASLSVGTAATPGTITNANTTPGDGLIIESTSSGSGSLIGGGTPNATVRRYVKANRWNMVSPSTTGVTAQTFSDASGSSSWLTWFDETVGTGGGGTGEGWTYMTASGAAVNVGQGYVYYPSVNETVAYKGNLQSADFSPAIKWSGPTYGYNAVGNPFSSALQWNTDTAWVLTHVEGTIWIYDGTQYQSYTQAITHEIPMGQGFFIHATGSAPVITIPASQRNHSHPLFLKSSKSSIGAYKNALIIKAQNNQLEDKVQISFGDSATDGFDNDGMAPKCLARTKHPSCISSIRVLINLMTICQH